MRPGRFDYVFPSKLIFKGIDTKLIVGYLEKNSIFNGANCPAFVPNNKGPNVSYLICLLNSSLITKFINSICPRKLGGYYRYNATNLSKIPIAIPLKEDQNKLELVAEKMTSLVENLHDLIEKFINRIMTNFSLDKLSKKHQSFYNHDFKTFLDELKKKKVKLSLKEQDEWEEYFNEHKNKILELQAEIDKTDREIDAMVYQLYGLTEEEIKIVEESVK